MQPSPQAQAFVHSATVARSVDDLVQALKPALEHEADLRKTFSAQRHNVASLDPHAGLVDIFAPGAEALRRTHARHPADEKDLSAKYVMPLKDDARRKTGEPAMVDSLDQFRNVWSVFSEGTLAQLGSGPWENVIVAGGSILAALLPLPARVTKQNSKRALRKWFHEDAIWATSDVDIFLYGLNGPEEAEKKCVQIYEAVRDSIPWDVTCVRTKHAITIHSQFPYRSVQIVLRLYASPAEVLAGFDVDCACVAYDGSRVWASPRAVAALMRQCNTIDVTRRSPSYEVRLAKYNTRGFEIAVPDLRREDIDPTIYERALSRMTGLARLLVLEKISSSQARMDFLSARRSLRGIPARSSQYVRRVRKFKGDLKGDTAGLDISSYESAMFHVPYGPRYDAARIEKIIYQNDLGLNSTFNPKNKKRADLHRHPAFFGTMAECLEDCCQYCPDPQDDDAAELCKAEDEVYIRGRVRFIEDDPGRQSVGSFKPLDAEDWAVQAYVGPLEKLFGAIARHDLASVKTQCADSPDLVSRDHVGRTALHVAIICAAPVELCAALVEAGARITSRLPDGRTPLMLAAQAGNAALAKLLLERSARNKADEEAKKAAEAAKAAKKKPTKVKADEENEDEDEDDEDEEDSNESWSDVGEKKETADGEDEDVIEAEDEQPDIIDLAVSDWNTGFNALLHSIAAGALDVLDILLQAGADAKTPVKIESNREVLYPLTATVTVKDENVAVEMARRLIDAGAHVGLGDASNRSIFHRAVAASNVAIVHAFLKYDSKTARLMLNLPMPDTPLVTAVSSSNLAMTVLLLAHGAKCTINQEDNDRAIATQTPGGYVAGGNQWRRVLQAVEASLSTRNDFYKLLVPLGAEINAGVRSAYNSWNGRMRGTFVEALRENIIDTNNALSPPSAEAPTWPAQGAPGSWKHEFAHLTQRLAGSLEATNSKRAGGETWTEMQQRKYRLLLPYLQDAEKYLTERDAKTWDEIVEEPDQKREQRAVKLDARDSTPKEYKRYDGQEVGDYAISGYDDLFEAAWKGDDARIVELCMPPPSHARDGPRPLEISVLVPQTTQNWNRTGFNPFIVACLAKRWHTARLILTIAAAQWDKPAEEKQASQVILDSDDDSNAGSEVSGGSEQQPIDLADIAARVSQVHSHTSPSDLITATFETETSEASTTDISWVLQKAVRERDLEAFVAISNMLEEHSKDSEVFMSSLLDLILVIDAPYILDELIRRAGLGIDTASASTEQDEHDADVPKTSKLYLGLNVHGKKRKDLARRSDPDAPGRYANAQTVPILWQAAKAGAVEIIAWLKTPSVASAFHFYAKTKTTDRALLLRRIDIENRLADLLGFQVSPQNETAVFAAIFGKSDTVTKTLKQLIKIYPDVGAHIHLTSKTRRLTPLLLLAALGGSPEALDFLLGQGVDVECVDDRGYNVLHLVCEYGHVTLFETIFRRVSPAVLNSLVSRQSYRRQNTPFMIAVKGGLTTFVAEMLKIQGGKDVVNTADVDMLPVHAATRSGYAEILALLLQHGADLSKENSLGETPLDIARREELKDRKQLMNKNASIIDLRVDNPHLDPVPRVPGEEEILRVRTLTSKLTQDGIWRSSNQALADQLDSFIDHLPQREKETAIPSSRVRDSCDRDKVLALVSASTSPFRVLVHLMDTQRSTSEALAQLKVTDDGNRQRTTREWHAEAEEDREGQSITKTWSANLGDGKDSV